MPEISLGQKAKNADIHSPYTDKWGAPSLGRGLGDPCLPMKVCRDPRGTKRPYSLRSGRSTCRSLSLLSVEDPLPSVEDPPLSPCPMSDQIGILPQRVATRGTFCMAVLLNSISDTGHSSYGRRGCSPLKSDKEYCICQSIHAVGHR